MKHQVGDKVKIKSLNWYNENKDNNGRISLCDVFDKDMSEYCGKVATIKSAFGGLYELDIDYGFWSWTDEMFEEMETLKTNTDATSKIDWEQRRYELVKTIMTGALENKYGTSLKDKKIVSDAIELADEAISRLKEGKL